MDARCPLMRIRGLSSSFDFGFVLLSRAYRGNKESSLGLLLILSDFCADTRCWPTAWIVHKSLPPAADEQPRLQVNAKSAGDIRLEKYLLLGRRSERNGS